MALAKRGLLVELQLLRRVGGKSVLGRNCAEEEEEGVTHLGNQPPLCVSAGGPFTVTACCQ